MPTIKQNLYNIEKNEYSFPDVETRIVKYNLTKEQMMEMMFESLNFPKKYVKVFMYLISVRDASHKVDTIKNKYPAVSARTYRQYLSEMANLKVEKEPLLFIVSRGVVRLNPIFIYNPNKDQTLILEYKVV